MGTLNPDPTICHPPRQRSWLWLLLAITVVSGLGSRILAGFLPEFVALNAGDFLWTIAVYLSFCILFPRWPVWLVLSLSLTVSLLVECSQLIDWWWLNAVRKNVLGQLVLGSGFLWADLVRYFAGGCSAAIIDAAFRPRAAHQSARDRGQASCRRR